jgi:DNA-binding NarL/FixJ family response regulator
MKVKIAIADDHELIIQGLSLMLESVEWVEIILKNNGGINLLKNLETAVPDILLLDIQMPGCSGIDLCRDIVKAMPSLKIIALTNFEESYYVKQMLRNGAKGYLLKNTGQDTLVKAIQEVMDGKVYLNKNIQDALINQLTLPREKRSDTQLTRRETEILKLIAEEKSNQEIADKLFISLRTVETHRLNLNQKLSAKNTAGLVKEAMKRGLV